MSEIVAVMGSPNSAGNTASAVGAILNGAMGLSTNMIKYHNLGKLNFAHGCSYCHRCMDTHRCVLNDDLTEVLMDIHNADTVIFATPIYFNMPTAQFKMVVDRMYAEITADRKVSDFKGKSAIILVTCSQIDEDTLGMTNLLCRSIEGFGFRITDRLIFSDNEGNLKFRDDPVAMKRAYLVGDTFSRPRDIQVNPEVVVLNGEQ